MSSNCQLRLFAVNGRGNGIVPNYVLRRRFYELINNGVKPSEIARAAGFEYTTKRGYRCADISRLRRALGIVHDSKVYTTAQLIQPKTAKRIGDALGLAPYEYGD